MKRLLKLLFAAMVVAVVCGFLSGTPDLSVLTEVGQAKEAEYQEWKQREDAYRLRQKNEERFRRRYERENGQ